MRDAMSLLDQVIAWAGQGQKLSGDDVARVLGVASRSVLHDLGSALVDGDAGRCLDIVADLAAQGYALQTVARDFLAHLRDLVVAKVHRDPKRLVELSDGELADVTALIGRAEADDLSRLYLGFSRSFDDIARSAQPRAAFEMALVRLARRPPLVPLDELLRRLDELKSGAPPAPPQRGGGTVGGGPKTAPAPERDKKPTPPVRGGQGGSVTSAWEAILADLRERKPAVASVYEHAAAVQVGPDRVVLAFEPGSFLLAQATESREVVAEAAAAHFGAATVVELDDTGRHAGVETVAARNSAEQAARRADAKKRVEEHPLVRAAVDLLGAELRDVRLPNEAG